MFLLGKTGERFGIRPSQLLNIEPDLALAFEVDMACDLHLRLLESKEAERVNKEIEEMRHRGGR